MTGHDDSASTEPGRPIHGRTATKVTLQVPQILNAALAASVVICMAQESPALVQRAASIDVAGWIDRALAASVILLFALKQYADEYRGFYFSTGINFPFAATLYFGSLCYLSLALAASNLAGEHALVFTAIYFLICFVWTTFSLVRRLFYRDFYRNAGKSARRLLNRLRWFAGNPMLMGLLLLEHVNRDIAFSVAIFAAVVVLFIVDAAQSRSFDPTHSGGV